MCSLDVATPLLCVKEDLEKHSHISSALRTCILNKTHINFNVDCSHTVIHGGQLVHGLLKQHEAMSVLFLIGWWKEGKDI